LVRRDLARQPPNALENRHPAALPEILSGIRTTLSLSLSCWLQPSSLAPTGNGASRFRRPKRFLHRHVRRDTDHRADGFAADRVYLALMRWLLRWQEQE
jgi:hypothetical protein